MKLFYDTIIVVGKRWIFIEKVLDMVFWFERQGLLTISLQLLVKIVDDEEDSNWKLRQKGVEAGLVQWRKSDLCIYI